MEGVGTASQDLDKREDSEAKDSLTALGMEAPVQDLNLQFYQGKIISEPHGVTVEEILSWFGDTYMLETYHGYIQWLFPTSQPSSSNRYAQPLQPEEAEAIQQDKMSRRRFLRAYLMMLDFFGMTIVDYGTGTLAPTQHYKDRLVNLNYSTHNHIRITRIIKSLGEMGLDRYQFPLVKFLLVEAIWTWRILDALPSARDFWIEAVKDASERKILKDYAVKLAKEVLDSVAPHATKGKVPCNCQTCAALREMRRLAPDYQPKAPASSDFQLKQQTVCVDPQCSNCRNKVFISKDRDHLVAQRVAQIEDLSHLTLELGKISARLNIVASERAQQKTIETPEQIEEVACLMDELKQVSIALGFVSTKLEALSLGEKIIQKNEKEMALKRLAIQSAEACTEEEPCSAATEPVHDATPDHTRDKREKADAFREESGKTDVRFKLESQRFTLDAEREVERAKDPLTQQSFSSTAKENAALGGLSTIHNGSHTENVDNGQRKNESSAAGNPISGAKEKRHLSKESAKKEELQASHKANSERTGNDQIIIMTERLFSDFNASLDSLGSDQGSRKESFSTETSVLSVNNQELKDRRFAEAKREDFGDSSEKSGTFVEIDGEDEEANLLTFEKQRTLESLQGNSWSNQNPRIPRTDKLDREGSGRAGKKDQDDLTKKIEQDKNWELNGDNQESEEALEEPVWMKAFRERSAQDKAAKDNESNNATLVDQFPF